MEKELTSLYAVGKLPNCAAHRVAYDAIMPTVIQW
jgi:hypothetical protein